MNNQLKNSVNFRDLYAFGKKLPIDLSLSENPLGCSPKVSNALKFKSTDFFHYPDADSTQLKKTIAEKFDISVKNIFVANGSEAIIKLLPQALLASNDEVIIPEVTFPMFEKAVMFNSNKVVFSKMSKNFDIDLGDIRQKCW